MKVRFLYHKPKGERGVGKLIVAWTWLLGVFYNWKVLKYNYSHEELWVPSARDGKFSCCEEPLNRHCLKYGAPQAILGQCFSSTTRGDADGVRFAPASEVLKHPERWDYIECEVDGERFEVGMAEAKRLEGGGYDYAYILSFFQPFVIQKAIDWACSEICDWLKYLWRIIPKRHKRISPRRSAYVLSKKWGQPKPVVELDLLNGSGS